MIILAVTHPPHDSHQRSIWKR